MRDFTEGKVLPAVVSFSIPLLLSNFLQTFSTVANTAIAGRILGPDALAAMAAPIPLIFLLASFLVGLSMAGNVIVAQAWGAKNIDLVKLVFPNSFMAGLLVTLAVCIPAIVFHQDLLRLLHVPQKVFAEARVFFLILASTLVLNFLFNWFAGILRGLGDAKTPMNAMGVSLLTNLVLVTLLVIVLRLGVAGVAWSMAGASLAGVLSCVWFAARKNPIFNPKTWIFRFDSGLVKKLLVIGLPASLQMVVTSLSMVAVMGFVNARGAFTTAAFGIASQFDQLAFMPAMTIGIAITSMAGQNIAADRQDRVKKILKVSILLTLAISGVFFIPAYFFPRAVAGLFTSSPEVAAQVALYYKWAAWSYFVYAAMFAFQGVIRAAGDMIPLLVMTFAAVIVARVPLAAHLSGASLFGAEGIWMSILISAGLGLLLSAIYYQSGWWKRVRVVAHSAPPLPAMSRAPTVPE